MTLSSRFDQAVAFASIVHSGQLRTGTKVPYIGHLLMVTAIALEYGATEDEAIAALLHDAIEDGGAHQEAVIRERFGETVADVVVGCTDTNEMPKPPAPARKAAYLERLRHETNRSTRFVSACDKLANVRSVLKDYREIGEDVFRRFPLGRKGTLDYYSGLAAIYRAHGSSPLVDELTRDVNELMALTGAHPAGEAENTSEAPGALALPRETIERLLNDDRGD